MSETESIAPPIKKEKKKATEAQMANLKKGMEVMKAKREALAKERDEFAKKQEAGEVPADAPAPKFVPKPIVRKEKIREERQVIVQPRKPKGPSKTQLELAALRTEISALKVPAVEKVVEVPVERIVEKIVPVEKTRVLTGSEMLNSIFFK